LIVRSCDRPPRDTNLAKFAPKLLRITHIVRIELRVGQCAASTTAPSILRPWCF
jgi:hypothetical protein